MAAAAIAGAALAYGVYAGERAEHSQRQSRYRNRAAQAEALRVQMVERQRSVQQEMGANRLTPAQTITLSDDMLGGMGTNRTGGIDDRLRLSRPSRLGGRY